MTLITASISLLDHTRVISADRLRPSQPVQGIEREVGLTIEFNEGWDLKAKSEVENALRKCISEPPEAEKWSVSLTTGLPYYCEVRVVTPRQKRSRLFFDDSANLPEAITEWIKSYPLR